MFAYKRVFFVHCCWYSVTLVTSHCQDKHVLYDVSKFLADQDNEEITVTLGHYAELTCCASSFTQINWYKEEGKTWDPIHPKPTHFDPLAPTITEEGQVLVLRSARESDQGNYKCVLEKDGRDADKRMMTLTVAECDELARGQYIISPEPCDITTVALDDTITLPCNGYFGCGDDEMRTVTWLVTESRGTPQWREAPDVTDRYSINYVERNGNAERGAYLTINTIQPEDLNRKFMCILSTPQVIKGESKLVVELQQQRRDTVVSSASMNVILMTVACAVSVILILIVVLTCLIRRKSNRNGNTRCSKDQDSKLPPPMEEENMFTSVNTCDV